MRTNLRKSPLLSGVLLLVPSLVAATPAAATPAGGAPAAGTAAAAAEPSEAGPRLQFNDGRSILLFSEQSADVPVARVGNDAITVRDLGESLAMTHSEHVGAAKKQDSIALLQRLVDTRLIVLEARDMGLDELPEVKNAIAAWRTHTLREALKARQASKVKLDAEAVESVYRQMVQEWKVRSVLFEREEDAIAFASSARDGEAFTAAAAKAIASGTARGKDEADYVGRAKGLPQVIAVLEKMKVGEVSAPTKIAKGFAVLFVEDKRFPDVPKARAEAEQVVRAPMTAQALRDYYKVLTKKYATVDRKLLASLDFKKSRLAALAKDKRAIARLRGEKPITVADLHAEMRGQFFHGLERAATEKKINPKKEQTLDSILFRRLLDKEAKELRVAEDPAFRRDAVEFERSALFAAFLERVIVPEVKVDDEAIKAYYDRHQDALRYPDFYKLETLAFRQAREAQAACEKLKAGTDVKWLKTNVEGQLDAKDRSVELDGTTVTADGMPEGLASALSGTSAGDCRIWPKSGEENYSVFVVEKIASRVQSLEEAKEGLQKQVFQEKLARSIEDWAKKLRQGHEVNVFVTGIGG